MLLQLQDAGRRIGPRWLFRDASLTIRAGDRIGIVGPNGSGKTSLLSMIAGLDAPDEGKVQLQRHTRLGLLHQEIDPNLEHSVEHEARTALSGLEEIEEEMRALELSMAKSGEQGEAIRDEVAERYDALTTRFTHSGGFEQEARVARVLAGLGFDEEARHRPLSSFSGGWLMRVELAKLFLAQPQVMLLDEPTNHLDLPSIQWFEEELADFSGALLIVSHDRTFLRRHVRRVFDLDGYGRCAVYEGDYDTYLTQREERRTQLLAQKANQDRDIAQMERFVERFRAKATKAKQAQSRLKALEKIDRIEIEDDRTRTMRLRIPAPPRSGQQVVSLKDIHKSYGENQIYKGVDFNAQRGERVALAGPNGAGKSTLLRIIAGALAFDGGERKLGHDVQLAFFAQHQLDALDSDASILDELTRSAKHEDVPRLRGHLGAFLFSGDDVDKKIGVLSGGEKARVALAKLLLRPVNVLVLDEPTNHLDIGSCEILEQALSEYAGTLIFVSHDRTFINKLATRVIEVKYGVLEEFIGNYDDYVYRKKQADINTSVSQKASRENSKPSQTPSPAHTTQTGDVSQGESKQPTAKTAAKPATKGERKLERERRKSHDRTQRKIEKLELEIAEKESESEQLGWRLADPKIYGDPEQVAAIQSEQNDLKAGINQLYSEWERANDELTALADLNDSP
ncbi:MAG: hypothetical protein CL917_02915 [Deltaproteobacteria bacterium]|nr:hypothetical protein [Deltaproteobacteria bacterium]